MACHSPVVSNLKPRIRRTILAMRKLGMTFEEMAKSLNKMKMYTVRGAKWQPLNVRYHFDKARKLH